MRQKLLFDKKNITTLTEKLSIPSKGVFFYLCKFLFTENNYYTLYDENSAKILSRADLKDYLFVQGMQSDSANNCLDEIFRQNVLKMEMDGTIICPELKRQYNVSSSKKRTGTGNIQKNIAQVSETIIAEPVKEVREIKEVKEVKEVKQKDKEILLSEQDVKAGLLFNIEEVQKVDPIKTTAKELLAELSERSRKAKAFLPTDANLKNIITRLKEGFTKEDIQKVIYFKCQQWRDTQKEAYLRPSTLFVPKNFETYLNEAISYYKQREVENKHSLNEYINKYYKRIPMMNLQMSYEECEKILKICPDSKRVRETLTYMENREDLLQKHSVFLTLKGFLENSRQNDKNSVTVIKSGVKA